MPPLFLDLFVEGKEVANFINVKEGEKVWVSFIVPKGQSWEISGDAREANEIKVSYLPLLSIPS